MIRIYFVASRVIRNTHWIRHSGCRMLQQKKLRITLSADLEEHEKHLKLVLQVLRKHQLFIRRKKCEIASSKVEYLGHIVTGEGVATNSKKIEAMLEWPKPTSVKALRGFLGLTGYYRRFVRGYVIIAKPLTQLLKKGAFNWNDEAEKESKLLKRALTTTLVLAMPKFEKQFVLETDLCHNGIGAVLMQEGQTITYLSKALSPRHLGLST